MNLPRCGTKDTAFQLPTTLLDDLKVTSPLAKVQVTEAIAAGGHDLDKASIHFYIYRGMFWDGRQ